MNLQPVLCSKTSHPSETPGHRSERKPPVAQRRPSTPKSKVEKKINEKTIVKAIKNKASPRKLSEPRGASGYLNETP